VIRDYFYESTQDEMFNQLQPMVSIMLLMTGIRTFQLLAAFQAMGPFLSAFNKISKSVGQFFGIFFIFLFSFSFFNFILTPDVEGFEGIISSMATMFRAMQGADKFDDISKSKFSTLGAISHIVYLFLANAILFNMLVAMMTSSYESVQNVYEAEALMERSNIILQMEGTMEKLTRDGTYQAMFPQQVVASEQKEKFFHEAKDIFFSGKRSKKATG